MKILAVVLRILGVIAGAFVLLVGAVGFSTGENHGLAHILVAMGACLISFSILFRSAFIAQGREKAAERARERAQRRAAKEAEAEARRCQQEEARQAEQAAWRAHVEQQKAEEARQAEEDFWRERARKMQEDALRAEQRASERSPYDTYWVQSPNQSKRQRRREARDQRRADAREQGIASCPRCGSTSLSVNKQGYGAGKAILFGPLAGTIGMNKLRITCLNCGYKYKPGKGRQ